VRSVLPTPTQKGLRLCTAQYPSSVGGGLYQYPCQKTCPSVGWSPPPCVCAICDLVLEMILKSLCVIAMCYVVLEMMILTLCFIAMCYVVLEMMILI